MHPLRGSLGESAQDFLRCSMFRRFRVWGVGVYVKYRAHGFGFSLEAQFPVVSWATVAVPYRIQVNGLLVF